jgi:hypothetical protein
MKIYVIGPVTGHDDLNVPAFEKARLMLSEAGYRPLIPHDFVAEDADWQQAMRRSIETLAKADGVAYLDGWQKSRGARIEWKLARDLGIEVAAVENWCACGSRRIGIGRRMRQRKYCARCNHILPVELFDNSSEKAGGLQSWCRDCMAEYKHERQMSGEPA